MKTKGCLFHMNDLLLERIVRCVESSIENPVVEITAESRLQEDLSMTSLELVMLQIVLEEEFFISFDPINDDFGVIFQTVSSVYRFVKERLE